MEGVTVDQLRRVVFELNLREVGRELLTFLKSPDPRIVAPAVSKIFWLTIGWEKKFRQILINGKYDWIHEDIMRGSFPINPDNVGVYEGCLMHFNRHVNSGEVIRAARMIEPGNPWSPGTIEHLGAFGEKFPSKKREYSIIALGSTAGIFERYVPSLNVVNGQRRLGLSLLWFEWFPDCHFLLVRRKSRKV